MLRRLHSQLGVWGAALILILAVTGVVLSVNPVLDRLDARVPATGKMSVAALADKVAANYPGVTQIQRTPNGAMVVYFSEGERTGADIIDPVTGELIAPFEPASWMRWVKNLHRSFFLDTEGRIATALGAALMLTLCITGAFMLAARTGGWLKIFHPLRGTLSERLHGILGRAAIVGLMISAATGLYLSGTSLNILPEGQEAEPAYPEMDTAGTETTPSTPLAPHLLSALQAIDINDLRELVYPYPDDPADNYSVVTHQGAGYVSPYTGLYVTDYQHHDNTHQLYEFIYALHTGEGLWWIALLLGLSALSVPVLTLSGIEIWWKRRSALPKLANNCRAKDADTIILVGSETNTTWGFANTLHEALTLAGYRVHTTSMNRLAKSYEHAQRMFILAATYGDGGPPASGKHFFSRLEKYSGKPEFRFAVLGFGDRQFPKFCQFAVDVDTALSEKGWTRLCPLDLIDRQSSQEFARWGLNIGEVIGVSLSLNYQPERPRTLRLCLAERLDYGTDLQEPASVFRFKAVENAGEQRYFFGFLKRHGLPSFEAGDLVGIFPPGSHVPRFYSLATSTKDGVLEICVRKHPEGLCSSYIHSLAVGDTIDVFIKHNPHFRPATSKAPIILIGAGTGIGPLAGFIRHNTPGHPMYLYWGGRNPQTDFLYKPELCRYLEDQRLTRLNTAFSRTEQQAYVQDKIVEDAVELRELIKNGAQILVCGGRSMAKSVTTAIDEIVAPLRISVQSLKAEGRYREDVY